jgi:2-iminobutanoate/2-iminopropanoate deaminase
LQVQREIISTHNAPAAIGPYSQAVKVSGNFMFLSGQIAITPTGDMIQGSVREQTQQILRNIEAVLAAGGLGKENVVKTTIFLTSMEHFGAVNEVYAQFFGENPPARSTVAVASLPRHVDVEIETIAVY